MRFLVDACADVRVAEWLRTQGYDTVHVRDEQLHRLPDEEVFAKAAREARTLLTFDLDFSEIVSVSGATAISVIVCRLADTRAAHVIERLAAVLPRVEPLLDHAAIVMVEETRFRVRHLPIR